MPVLKRANTTLIVRPRPSKRQRLGALSQASTQTQTSTRAVTKRPRVEVKQSNYTGVYNGIWNYNGFITDICPIEAGDSAHQRNGRVIKLESLSFRIILQRYNDDNPIDSCRVIIGLWKGYVQPTVDMILSSRDYLSPYDVDFAGEYNILYDKMTDFNAQVVNNNAVPPGAVTFAGPRKTLSGKLNLGGTLQKFASDDGGSYVTPRLFILVISQQVEISPGAWNASFGLSFTDV